MVVNIPAAVAVAFYVSATLYHLLRRFKPNHSGKPTWLLAGGAIGLGFHGWAAATMLITPAGINFSLWPVSVLIVFTVNLIVLLSSIKKPLHSLFILLFPTSAAVLLASLFFGYTIVATDHLSLPIGLHVTLSLVAYSLFIIAAMQSLLLAYQDNQLKNHHPGGLLHSLPPLQTMETLLFEIIWVGFIVLSLAMITGFVFVDNLLAQHLVHKTFFSMIGWLVFAILLWGRVRQGWRGAFAIRWTIAGFALLALAYWGSKFVIEVLLGSQIGG
ncbi:MAG: cytochrome c biogenesis protein CcsA [Porticoccaceae bacterium]|nr:cytochrome c biogenesis protein CcsA [Porticoccaceae bacterium]